MRYNRPGLNWVWPGLALAGVFSVALGVFMLASSDWGTSTHPVYSTWFLGGLASIANGVLVCGVLLLGLHAFVQREVTVTESQIVIQRWLSKFLGRSGETVTLDQWLRARFFVKGGGAKLSLDRPGVSKTFSIWFWRLDDARSLAERLARDGVSVEWELPYPLDAGRT